MAIRTVTDAIRYVGVDDNTLALFENQYPVQPMGVSYNSYVILDEKIAVMDSVDARAAEEYGRMQPGETPAREITLPRRTDGKTKVSRTVRTILEGKATPELALPGIKQLVAEGAFS